MMYDVMKMIIQVSWVLEWIFLIDYIWKMTDFFAYGANEYYPLIGAEVYAHRRTIDLFLAKTRVITRKRYL